MKPLLLKELTEEKELEVIPYIRENFRRISEAVADGSIAENATSKTTTVAAPTSLKIPEYNADPSSPTPGDVWVLRGVSGSAPTLSHTLLQIGLTAPGGTLSISYSLKFRTELNTTVAVPLT